MVEEFLTASDFRFLCKATRRHTQLRGENLLWSTRRRAKPVVFAHDLA